MRLIGSGLPIILLKDYWLELHSVIAMRQSCVVDYYGVTRREY